MPTEASPDRRRRYDRDLERRIRLNDKDADVLSWLSGSRYLTTHQLQALTGLSDKVTRSRGRRLYDAGMAARLEMPPVVYSGSPYGSAPDVYCLTQKGASWLVSIGYEDEPPYVSDARRKSLTMLPHELMVSDVRVWAVESSDGRTVRWHESPDSKVGPVKPDAWFSVAVDDKAPPTVLVGIVEADRGSEREDVWKRKADQYAQLLENPGVPFSVTGYRGWRLLIVCPGWQRRDRVASWLVGTPVAARAWVTTLDALALSLHERAWVRPGKEGLHAMLG